MREDIEICDFTAGELSPKLKGRTDYEGYFDGLEIELNMISLPQGGATRRPGTLQAGLSKDQTDTPFRVRNVRFVFSTVQPYNLEFSDGNVRVYMNDAVVLNGDDPVDIAVPYTAADLAALEFVQSADTLFICHASYPPATLARSSHTDWTYSASAFVDGPYLDKNLTDTTLSPSGTSGSITITASSIVGINATPTNTGQGFLPSDEGRCVRIRLFSLWAWCLITHVTDTTHVTATVQALVNGGAYGSIDGADWVENTKYPTDAVVKNFDKYYIAIEGGVSSSPNGPSGTGDNIIDGTVTWSLAGPFNATVFAHSTIYICGDVCYNTSVDRYYICTRGGISPDGKDGDPDPPSGTGADIAWNGMTWTYIAPFTFPTSTKEWRLGKWTSALGYPYLPIFWQQRLAFLGTNNQPGAVEASVSSDFTNMAPTQANDTVLATNALSWVISDDQVNAIRWAVGAGSSVTMQLGIGTTGGEFIMQPATNAQALSALNVQVYPETHVGSAPNVPAIRIGKSVLFVNRPGRKLFEWIWQWQVNGMQPIDRTVDAEHITRSDPADLPGIVATAYQQEPYGIIWCVLGDGSLIGMTYLPEEKVIAWHRHQLGGQYYGAAPFVESVSCIPSPDGSYDELWLSVLRTVAGVPTRTIEVMTRFFDGNPQEEAFFADCGQVSGLAYPNATLSFAARTGNGIAFSANASVFASGDVAAGTLIRVNGGVAKIATFIDAEHITADWQTPALSTKAADANAWSYTPQFATFSGADVLDGETVQILGDGADLGTAVVTAGVITLDDAQTASLVIAGLPYTFMLLTMPWAPKRALPVPASGKTKNIDHLYVRLHETLGCKIGRRRTDPTTGVVKDVVENIKTRSAGNLMGQAPPLQSGMQRLASMGGNDEEGQIIIAGTGPYPCTVLAIAAAADVGMT